MTTTFATRRDARDHAKRQGWARPLGVQAPGYGRFDTPSGQVELVAVSRGWAFEPVDPTWADRIKIIHVTKGTR